MHTFVCSLIQTKRLILRHRYHQINKTRSHEIFSPRPTGHSPCVVQPRKKGHSQHKRLRHLYPSQLFRRPTEIVAARLPAPVELNDCLQLKEKEEVIVYGLPAATSTRPQHRAQTAHIFIPWNRSYQKIYLTLPLQAIGLHRHPYILRSVMLIL